MVLRVAAPGRAPAQKADVFALPEKEGDAQKLAVKRTTTRLHGLLHVKPMCLDDARPFRRISLVSGDVAVAKHWVGAVHTDDRVTGARAMLGARAHVADVKLARHGI